ILRNPAYTGRFRWAGETYQGRYEPLITKELFDRVQTVIDRRRPPLRTTQAFAYKGLLRCGTCTGLLSGDRKKGKYVYYACNGTKGCRRTYPERWFDTLTQELLNGLHLPGAIVEWLAEELDGINQEASKTSETERLRLTQQRTELQHLITAAYKDKLRGTITE